MKIIVLILVVVEILSASIETFSMLARVFPAESESTQESMKLTPEQEMETAKFPTALRTLIETELAVGNSIIEIGHSFPAPPAGAYVKLANKVSTRKRGDGDGLSFYERNSSSFSGEFTDAQRFYFVLEPPNAPPDELDMDAMRKSLEPQTNFRDPDVQTNTLKYEREPYRAKQPLIDWDSSQAFSIAESETGSTRILHFRDKRPPHEVQFALERDIRTLFTPSMDGDTLCMNAKANVVGADYAFTLRFEAALPEWNCYSLRAKATWGALPSDHADYYRKTSGSWFEVWTRAFIAANRPLAGEGSPESYQQLCKEALVAEKHLDSVAAIQQSIIAAVKVGARYHDSHKEGGTRIYWDGKRFVRSDYGDYPDEQYFTDEREFLKMLYQHLHWVTTSRSGKEQLSEIDTWRLIQRRMEYPSVAFSD